MCVTFHVYIPNETKLQNVCFAEVNRAQMKFSLSFLIHGATRYINLCATDLSTPDYHGLLPKRPHVLRRVLNA